MHSASPHCCSLDGYILQVHTAVGGKGLHPHVHTVDMWKGIHPHSTVLKFTLLAVEMETLCLSIYTAEGVDRCTLHLSEC